VLEPIFQNLLKTIKNTVEAHMESPDDNTMRSRSWEFIFNNFEGWIVLYCSSHSNNGGYWIYPMLHPVSKIERLRKQLPRFNIDQNSAAYGHVMSSEEHWLEPYWGSDDSFENGELPFFFHRQYYGYPVGKENYYESITTG
jgi:hypothetical protein